MMPLVSIVGAGSRYYTPSVDSPYRESVYGPPSKYADPTRSLASSGTGTSGDPWNLNQAMANAVAGDVVGLMESGSSAVQLATTDDDNFPAFDPTNSGTSGSKIVFTTKYAAIALASVETNANRTELKHNGSAPGISGGGTGTGTGCAIYGSNGANHITYDGIYTDMSTAYMKEDSGVIRFESCTGLKACNFVVKGATLTVASNPVIYRPQDATDAILSNFTAYDFVNNGAGSATPQTALFSDQYGDQNFTVEFFEIYGIARGPFAKGSGFGGALNYGVYKYGVVHDCAQGFRVNGNATDAPNSHYVDIQYCLVYNYTGGGVVVSNEGSPPYVRNVRLDHVTLCEGLSDINQNGSFYMKSSSAGTSGISVQNSILDIASGVAALINAGENTDSMQTYNYNGYYRGGGAGAWSWNGSNYTTLVNWRGASGTPDLNSSLLGSDPFTNRAADNFTVAAGSAALTLSSTGGQVGAYAGAYVPGVQV